MALPTDIDTTYADDGVTARKLHQQHHDTLHSLYNTWEGQTPALFGALDDDETITGTWSFPTINVDDILTKGPVINVTHPDYGATGDGTTDDTAAIQAALDAVGDTTTLRSGTIYIPAGVYRITSTLTVERKSVVIFGDGWGDNVSNAGTIIQWDGAAGGTPMLRLHRNHASRVERIVFAGHATNTPSAGISMYQVTGDGLPNSFNRISQCHFGRWSFSSYDELLVAGVLFEGDNLNNDKNIIEGCQFDGCTTAGVDIQNSQNVLNRILSSRFAYCGSAVKAVADVVLDTNVIIGSTVADFYITGGATLTSAHTHSEDSARLATIENSAALILRGGKYQIDDNLNVDDRIIENEWAGTNTVSIESFAFESAGYTRGGTPTLTIRPGAGSATRKVVRLVNVSGLTESNLDVAPQAAGDVRIVEGLILGTSENKVFRNLLKYGGVTTVDFDRVDNPNSMEFPATFHTGVHQAGFASTGAANTARWSRLVSGGLTISKVALHVGTSSGNIDVAVHSNTGSGRSAKPGTLLSSSGSTACPAAGYAEVSLGSSVTPLSGDWMGIAPDNNTATFLYSGGNSSQLFDGMAWSKSTSFPITTNPAPTAVGGARNYLMAGVA